MRVMTSSASAICGTSFGWTKEVDSIRFNPLRESASTSSTFCSVGMNAPRLWIPSRGPTSRILTEVGRAMSLASASVRVPPVMLPLAALVRREAERHVARQQAAVAHLDQLLAADALTRHQARQHQVEDGLVREHLARRQAED